MAENHGKASYWLLCTYAMNEIRNNPNYDYYIKFDDDGRLEERFFERCINIWKAIRDSKKICLNFRLDSREGKRVWTNIRPIRRTFNGVDVYKSQWVDMDFFTTYTMFKRLDFFINPPDSKRLRNPLSSSGCGRDLSLRLHRMGYHLYLTTESLVRHDDHQSMMNPKERARTPLTTKPFNNPLYGLNND
jgi:hypothetical protein